MGGRSEGVAIPKKSEAAGVTVVPFMKHSWLGFAKGGKCKISIVRFLLVLVSVLARKI